MAVLDRKLARNLARMKGQVTAISLVMACGVAMLVMSLSTLNSLRATRDTYYARYRFAEVFAHVRRAPDQVRDRIAAIDGVSVADTRIVEDVSLDVPGLAEPAVGRLIAVPERGEARLNHTHLRRGRRLRPGTDDEVLCSEAFAEAHGFDPGDTVEAVVNGRRKTLTIVGVVLSPEYVYQVRPGELLADDERFGIFWMGYRALAAAFDMEGAFNDVSLTLQPGAAPDEVLRRLDALLEPYGGIGAYTREEQMSARYLSEEIRQLGGMGLMLPVIFLGVAAFLINVVLSRLVETEREQIAVLKAFGYTPAEIAAHYFKLVLVIAAFGIVLGTLAGVWLGNGLTRMYVKFYRFPIFRFDLQASVVAIGALSSAGAALLGVARAVARSVRVPPAEGMRPRPPASYRATVVERLGLQTLLNQSARMVLRNLERQPARALLTCLGIALAASILIVGSFSKDILDHMMAVQFNVIERYDVLVTFVDALPREAVEAVARMPGVIQVEPFRAVPATLRFGHRARRLAVTGMRPDGDLHRPVNRDLRRVHIPEHGVVMSAKLAELLGLAAGDTLTIDVMEGRRPTRRAVVAGTVNDYTGLSVYMSLRSLNALMNEPPVVSGVYATVERGGENGLYDALKRIPRVAAVTVKRAAWQSFQETMAENLLSMRVFNILFACVIACGVVYNAARISLSERSRELATLRVIGFTRREISAILLGELALLVAAAVPAGMLMGYGLAALVCRGLDTDLYRFPLVVRRGTFMFSAGVTVVAAVLSGLIVRRRIDRLDLIAVLKTRE